MRVHKTSIVLHPTLLDIILILTLIVFNSPTAEGNPVTCGTQYKGKGCYKYEARNDKWTRIGQMIEAR